MLNAFTDWLIRNWDLIVEIFIWGMSLLMGFVLVAKIYKIVKFEFEARDAISIVIAGLWICAIIFIGFDHIRLYLQSFL